MAAGRSALAQVPYGGAHEAVPGVRPRSRPPQKPAREYRVYPALIERCAELEPVSTAVAHPCDESSLTAAIEAAEADLIRPVLVGPENKIRSVAEQFGLDIRPKIPSTIDAAALCKMAERGQITGALLDGPLAFDNSISKEAAGNVTVVGTKADVSFSDVLDNLSMARLGVGVTASTRVSRRRTTSRASASTPRETWCGQPPRFTVAPEVGTSAVVMMLVARTPSLARTRRDGP
jgi:hypothetical protein